MPSSGSCLWSVVIYEGVCGCLVKLMWGSLVFIAFIVNYEGARSCLVKLILVLIAFIVIYEWFAVA